MVAIEGMLIGLWLILLGLVIGMIILLILTW